MSQTVLLYGATGYAGRLIAAEGARTWNEGNGFPVRMLLAGRDGAALEALARKYGVSFRVFGLDYEADIVRGLSDVQVVINAAGPFAFTAGPMARAALVAGCHYVDINEEMGVYKTLDDKGHDARQKNVALVCSAGYRAAASDLLLSAALESLQQGAVPAAEDGLGAVRIGMSHGLNCSRGSAATTLRSLREQVAVVRHSDEDGGPVLWHEPVGKLERTFDFSARADGKRDLRIASAANLVDTLTARVRIMRTGIRVRRIESYVEADTAVRFGYQVAAAAAPLVSLPWMRTLVRYSTELLPEGPTDTELAEQREILLLEIEDVFRTRIIDWRWETPNAYQFTAQVVVAISGALASGAKQSGEPLSGWVTPAEVLRAADVRITDPAGALRGCRLEMRAAGG
jgi:short subunit dehydrogenase-like uncharacterized protein